MMNWFLVVTVICSVCVVEVFSMDSCAGFVKPVNSTFPYGFSLKSDYWSNWYDAYNFGCRTLHPDAQLAYLREKAALVQCLTLVFPISSNASWIAIRQFNSSASVTNDWYWADEVPLSGNASHPRYFQWASGEPNSGASNRCADVWGNRYAIADDDCYGNYPALCEVHGRFELIFVVILRFFRF
jgi:hypothetical protein